jgi:hypothetical protein
VIVGSVLVARGGLFASEFASSITVKIKLH